MSTQQQILASCAAQSVTGQVAYTAPGTYSWTVPTGVTSVSAVAVGRGYNGTANRGGGGGALSYVNNLTVTPGEVLTVVLDGVFSRLHRAGASLLLANSSTYAGGANTAGAVGDVVFAGGGSGSNHGGGGAA